MKRVSTGGSANQKPFQLTWVLPTAVGKASHVPADRIGLVVEGLASRDLPYSLCCCRSPQR